VKLASTITGGAARTAEVLVAWISGAADRPVLVAGSDLIDCRW